LECGELLHEGGAQSQIWLRQLNQNLQIAAPCGGAPREGACRASDGSHKDGSSGALWRVRH
jgi:hypothetical protein